MEEENQIQNKEILEQKKSCSCCSSCKPCSSGFVPAGGVVIYVFVVSLLMSSADQIFGKMQDLWGPVAFLMLFVLSATIVGLLIFSKPLILCLDGKRKEGIKLLFSTVLWLFFLTLVIFLVRLI